MAVGRVEPPWVDRRAQWAGAVITQYVSNAFPCRSLISGIGFGSRRDALLDAFAGLLVELHLHGMFWGDCSLSNILYRWDASSIEAIMIDAETSRIFDSLSRGQRREDIEIMRISVAGEMADIAAQHGADPDDADMFLGDEIASRYDSLWKELTTSLVVSAGDHYRIRQRIDRLHGLGVAVEEIGLIPVDNGTSVKIRVKVRGRQYHSEQLREMIGVDVSENQARIILSDLAYHEARLGGSSATGKNVAAMKSRASAFEPLIVQISELHPGLDPCQGYCDFLSFRLSLVLERDKDVPNSEAFTAWSSVGFPGFKDFAEPAFS